MRHLVGLAIAIVIAIAACTQPASSSSPAIPSAPATNANPTPAALEPSPIEPGYGTPSPGT